MIMIMKIMIMIVIVIVIVCVCLFRFHVFPMKHLWDQTPQAARSANFSAPASDAQAIAQLAKKLLDPGGSSHGMQMMFSKIHVAW